VATPPLVDPNFDRTVVLVLEHTSDGAFGLVINRPSGTPADTAFPYWTESMSLPGEVFIGGPVQPEAMIALAHGPCEPAEGWSPVLDHLGTADLSRLPADLPPLATVRVFAGYSGWSPGQLDRELAQHAWIVVDAEPGDPFTESPADLWRTVLARQGGELSWLANFPDDVAVN
jgi:putative transcriptional regulator